MSQNNQINILKKLPPAIIAIFFVVFLILVFMSSVILEPGEKGVVFRPFTSGLDNENVLSEGFHVIFPWNKVYKYDVREQQMEEKLDVLDKNGLSIQVDISIRFYPIHNRIPFLHENFGKNYLIKLIIPEIRSNVRSIMGRYNAEQIFSTKRKEVEDAIFAEAKKVLANDRNNINITALLIRSIVLPPQIKNAIEKKLKEEQEALAYKFKLQREKSEAERKKIEAEGIATYNQIINASLSDKVLEQKGIDATLELAKDPNSKIVIIGNNKNGLPLILGDK